MPDEGSPRHNVHGQELAAANHGPQNLIAATPDRGSLDRSTFLRRAVIPKRPHTDDDPLHSWSSSPAAGSAFRVGAAPRAAEHLRQPTEPSIWIWMRRFISTVRPT
jgi:hypothetical protein